MTPKYIAAIEIGSANIKGIVAEAVDGQPLKVLEIQEAPAAESVRHGRVRNAREANEIVNDIIRRLENSARVKPGRIATVFIADGGRSLLSTPSDAALNFGGEEEFTLATLDRLHKDAVFKLGTARDILAIAPRRFFIDSAEVKKIVGAFGSTVRGEFTIITQAPENHRAIERLVIESNGHEVHRDFVTRLLAQTEMALSDTDRQVGTLYVDFGAETTSMAAFRDGSLVFAATLPIGGANITRDLSTALNVTFDKAELLKRSKGTALVDRNKFDAPDDEVAEIVAFVSARAGEIVANVTNLLVESGLRPADFPGGMVISGGGANLKGFAEMVEQLSKMKVRRAAVDSSVALAPGVPLADNFDVIALAKYAAAHSATDCIEFPAKAELPQTERPAEVQPKQPVRQPSQPEQPRREASAGVQPGRRAIAEDDPRLLDDDIDDLEQPSNVNNDESTDLPEPEPDANATRNNLLAKLKRIGEKTLDLFKAPVSAEEDGMDS